MASLREGLPLPGVADGAGIRRASFGVGERDKVGLEGLEEMGFQAWTPVPCGCLEGEERGWGDDDELATRMTDSG
jgi:hypothetical protein